MTTSGPQLVARYFDMWNTGDGSVAEVILDPHWTDHAHPDVAGPLEVAAAVERLHATRRPADRGCRFKRRGKPLRRIP